MEPRELQTDETHTSPPPPPEAKTSTGYWRWWVAAVGLGIAVTVGAYAAVDDTTVAATPPSTTAPQLSSAAPAGPSDAISDETPTVVAETPALQIAPTPLLLDAAQVGRLTIPSVVTVQIRGTSLNGQQTLLGSGSGVVYDTNGHILTNDHVVASGDVYEVVLADGRIYPAELVGTDPTTDLAVLKVGADDLVPIKPGSSDELTVGDPAVAVGSPLGLDGGPSLTVGVISAFGRDVQTDPTSHLYGMLQTDAPITSGSSGGALVNSDGELIGITTAVGVSAVGIEGIGFATPIEIVTRVASELISDGSASDPYLGIYVDPALEETADGGSVPIGIGIASLETGMAAAEAGLSEGDIIAAINGTQIKTFNELVAELRRYGAGTAIDVTLADGSSLELVLGQRPSDQ